MFKKLLIYFFFFFGLCWVFIAVRTSCSCGEWGCSPGAESKGCSLVVVRWLLITVASFAEHQLRLRGLQELRFLGSKHRCSGCAET